MKMDKYEKRMQKETETKRNYAEIAYVKVR